MTTETCTHADILHRFGPIADHLASEILDLRPSPGELEVAAAYIAGLTDVMGEVRAPLTGKAARVFEIVSRDELLDEEELRA
jgi:hypothetical protein